MCQVIEDMRKEAREKATVEATQAEKKMTVLRMLRAGKYALEEIAGIAGLSLNEVQKLKQEQGE